MNSTIRQPYAHLVRLLLIELRGKQTQKKLSEKLGYKFNQWHKWESGQKSFMWNDFVKALDILKIKIDKPLSEILDFPIEDLTKVKSGIIVKKIIQKYGGLNGHQAQKKLKISRSALMRILNSKKDAELAFVFLCFGQLSTVLPFLFGKILKKSNNKAIQELIQIVQKQNQLEADFPWLSAIEAFIETEEYKKLPKHSDKFISEKLGLSTATISNGLQLLLENQAVLFSNEKFQLNYKRVDLNTEISHSAKFAHYWTEMCSSRFLTLDHVPLSRKGWSSRVFPVSEEAQEQIYMLRKKFIADMNQILQIDGPRTKKHVQVFIMHIFDELELKPLFQKIKNTQN